MINSIIEFILGFLTMASLGLLYFNRRLESEIKELKRGPVKPYTVSERGNPIVRIQKDEEIKK
jgi:hypothetical protein